MSTIYTSKQLLTICKAEQTQTNNCIAQTIINMYMQSKNFYENHVVECMKDFLSNGTINFRKYNIEF